jgi:hypothetical protein
MDADRPRNAVGAPFASLLLIYAAASLFHHIHNAEFLADYPNMPAWLSRGKVYAAWLGVTAVGLAGCLLVRRGHRLVGLCVLAIYAASGFDGLGHYVLAPLSAHTATMNLTIGVEVATATLLLIVVARLIGRQVRMSGSP